MATPLTSKDFYKTDHRRQYPDGTELVYSNLTPRESRIEGVEHVVVFGIQSFICEYLIKRFNEEFFNLPKEQVVGAYKRRLDNSLGKDAVSMDHVEALHDLGYLPIEIKALPEGTRCPLRVPMLTIWNTKKEFFWLTNDLETILSTSLWMPMTSATTADRYRTLLDNYATETSDTPEFVDFQGHDFSMRGHGSLESASASGAAHLLSFKGTDTIPAIDYLERYYGANAKDNLIGCSVPATEHSVMCMGGEETEIDTFRRLMKLYPTGVLSVVSDTWDYWKIVDEILPQLKNEIMARDGKLVIRPDSGDPVDISIESIQSLWDIFGGTTNSKGYKQLDPHIGLIYGDSITFERCDAILHGLQKLGFASTNMVFGIGSYTYQYVTRDTFGFAVKATYGIINGEPINIFKDPKTDSGMKKSAKGLLRVNDDLTLSEEVDDINDGGLLETVFRDGKLVKMQSLWEIRARLKGDLVAA